MFSVKQNQKVVENSTETIPSVKEYSVMLYVLCCFLVLHFLEN